MARSRSVPTNLFENPDFFERSSETQVTLLGLLLDADDAGRGLAHPGLLARKFNKEVASIETALAELQSCEMLDCYQVGRHTYYSLRHWQQWQTLSKPTPSKFPAPPSLDEPSSAVPNQACPASIQLPQGNPGEIGETLSEGEEEEEGEAEEEGKLKRSEGEGVASQPGNVIPFPTTPGGTGSALSPLSQEALAALTSQVAAILKLAVSPALQRVVQDYGTNSALSLLGEADAAREWMDRQGRTRKGLSMSPAFFRRWLKREVEERASRQGPQRATGTTGRAASASPPRGSRTAPADTPPSPGEDQYQAYLQRRVQAVQAAHAKYPHQGG